MVAIPGKGLIDFSFICSLKCNLHCPFCMYDAGPDNREALQFHIAKQFIDTIDWDKINSIGFYGGEISADYVPYEQIIQLLPYYSIQKFCITNGSWSRNVGERIKFYDFIYKYNILAFISTTPNHRKYQDVDFLDEMVKNSELVSYKSDDTLGKLLPMGRNSQTDWACSTKCESISGPKRMAMLPNGDIIFQSCDGVYPKIGDHKDSFESILNKEIKCQKLQKI